MKLKQTSLLVLSAIIFLSGCHLIIGPSEEDQEWWYYCDASGCYMCNAYGCELPGSSCSSQYDCPSNMWCDGSVGTCKTDSVCLVSEHCRDGEVCLRGQCTTQWGPYSAHCLNNEDCAVLGPNLVCDEQGTCVTGELPLQTCETGSACSDGLCVEGNCASCSGDCGGSTTCQYDKHCADGQACLDGKCTATCTVKEDCGKGQTCQGAVCVADPVATCGNDKACASGEICVNNACHADCTAMGSCRSVNEVCTDAMTIGTEKVRVCLPDTSASYECKLNKDCTGGELCVNGVCRTSCVVTEDCAVCEDGPVCSKGFCMTEAEASPQCNVNADCTSGKVCLNAQCVTL